LFVTHSGSLVAPGKPDTKSGIVISGSGADGPSAAFLVAAASPAADVSTRAAAIAGAMLAVLAAAVSVAWALYKFKPGVIKGAGVGPPSGSGSAAAQGNQETPLLLTTAAVNGQSAAGDATLGQIQTTDVDLANYFSPMSTTATMNQGVQADLDLGAAGWTTSSALAARSSVDEVSKSRSGGLSGGGAGTGTTMNVGTQTANLLTVDMTSEAPATGTTAVYSHDSRTVTNTTRDVIQVRRSVLGCFVYNVAEM